MKMSPAASRPRSMNAITWRLAVFALAVWLLGAGLITHCIALELYTQMQHKTQVFASHYAEVRVNYTEEKAKLPGYAEYCRIHAMQFSGNFHELYSDSGLFPSLTDGKGISYDKDDVMPYHLAISYADSDNNTLTNAGNYLLFPYMTTELWQTATDTKAVSGFTYIDLTKVDDSCYTSEGAKLNFFKNPTIHKYYAGRFTGYFEKNEFIPVGVDCFTWKSDAILAQDRAGKVNWRNIYQAPVPEGKELVTIYGINDFGPLSFHVGSWNMGSVTIDGTRYNKLVDVLPCLVEKENLTDAVVVAYDDYIDTAGEEIHVRVALRASPLQFTVRKLVPFYLISFMLVMGAVWLILHSIRKNLVLPIEQIARRSGGNPTPLSIRYNPRWLEAGTLEENYDTLVDAYYHATAEVNQLKTSLEYAQNAELHRRQMVSNITHELKTPLAIIHSYAEGLNEGIAAEKQEQYLKVILEESERMDSMVLEMLDLSRLEAGKVRLSTDHFSLLGLTRSIFDRLAPVAEEKGLQIHYTLAEEFDITADENRIGQVITNFATNAMKYTSEGGNIWIRVYQFKGKSFFILSNEGTPLPEDALEKVWDSFYRVEASRTTKGTGLGLSIAKAIVELHGGTVQARNSAKGVEFEFTLP